MSSVGTLIALEVQVKTQVSMIRSTQKRQEAWIVKTGPGYPSVQYSRTDFLFATVTTGLCC